MCVCVTECVGAEENAAGATLPWRRLLRMWMSSQEVCRRVEEEEGGDEREWGRGKGGERGRPVLAFSGVDVCVKRKEEKENQRVGVSPSL